MEDELYRELILEHYKKPQNFGHLEDADLEFSDVNPFCGDEQTITLKLDENGVVSQVAFEGSGCAISIAATSMLTELLLGLSPKEILELPKEVVLDELGVPISLARIKCALLGLKIAKSAASGQASDWDADTEPEPEIAWS